MGVKNCTSRCTKNRAYKLSVPVDREFSGQFKNSKTIKKTKEENRWIYECQNKRKVQSLTQIHEPLHFQAEKRKEQCSILDCRKNLHKK